MRLPLLLLLVCAAIPAWSDDPPKDSPKATNTICPNSGEPIDASVTPVAATTSDGKKVEIGACCAKCQAMIKADPAKYADAAAKNQKVAADATDKK